MSLQVLTHRLAKCTVCAAECDRRNATAWAHQHAQRSGHDVELFLSFTVSAETPGPALRQAAAAT